MKNLLKSKVYNYIRSLNWGVAFLILCLSYLGTITNENINGKKLITILTEDLIKLLYK